jgi:pimeloyl-ACP methyl ester carboxylesterase
VACLLLAAAVSACATPIGVRRVDVQTVHRDLTASVLSTGRPSAPTAQLLHRLGLFDRFTREPDAVLAELHAGLAPTDDEVRVYALAELSFLHGERQGDPMRLLAAACYAYAFLFPGEDGAPPEPFDPRLRVASDLYNRALTGGLLLGDEGQRGIEGGRFRLPFGTLVIRRTPPEFVWAGYRFKSFQPAADYEVRGLRNRYRRRGIGAPLAARISSELEDAAPPPGHQRIPDRVRVPVALLLRLERPRAGLASGRLRGTLSLYSQDDAREVTIDGREVPLEFETTATMALALETSGVWEFERRGFRIGDFRPQSGRLADGLFMRQPYRPGRIPVVLVHGTASSPARWAELVNELENDPRIWERYQIWLFIYNTGNPVALSGGALAEALRQTVAELDPEQQDPALSQMVVIGHSQGGLLTKLTAVDSGDLFWDRVSDVPLDELQLEPETRALLEQALFFEPLPFVRRVVFIATPHRGSYLTLWRIAGFRPARWAARLVELPGDLAAASLDLMSANPDRELRRSLEDLPTSIDNMTPGNPFLEALALIPLAPRVSAHSIIAVQGDGPPEEGSDGVVRFESASIEGVESELVVRSSHSTQSHPQTIEEVRRILLEHAAAFEGEAAPSGEGEQGE